MVIGSGDSNVYALEGSSGTLLWSFSTGGYDVNSSPAIGDLDGDNLDVVFGSDDNNIYDVEGNTGSKLWNMSTGGDVDSSPALGDLDSDNGLDVIIGSTGYKVYALDREIGVQLWSFATKSYVRSSPALGDLDGNGNLDIVFGSRNNKIHAASCSNSGNRIYWAGHGGDNEFLGTRCFEKKAPDSDCLSSSSERLLGTDTMDFDSDSDLMPDGWEGDNKLDPLSNDFDNNP